MNLYNRTPLAGVQLFNRSSYPKDLGVYSRGDQPIHLEVLTTTMFLELTPFFDRFRSFFKILSCSQFESFGESYCVAEVKVFDRIFWVTSTSDILSFSLKKPIFTEIDNFKESSRLSQSFINFLIQEGLYAISYSPVDLYWLVGEKGQEMALYGDEIWRISEKHLKVSSLGKSVLSRTRSSTQVQTSSRMTEHLALC